VVPALIAPEKQMASTYWRYMEELWWHFGGKVRNVGQECETAIYTFPGFAHDVIVSRGDVEPNATTVDFLLKLASREGIVVDTSSGRVRVGRNQCFGDANPFNIMRAVCRSLMSWL
jgi:hypothetical protein